MLMSTCRECPIVLRPTNESGLCRRCYWRNNKRKNASLRELHGFKSAPWSAGKKVRGLGQGRPNDASYTPIKCGTKDCDKYITPWRLSGICRRCYEREYKREVYRKRRALGLVTNPHMTPHRATKRKPKKTVVAPVEEPMVKRTVLCRDCNTRWRTREKALDIVCSCGSLKVTYAPGSKRYTADAPRPPRKKSSPVWCKSCGHKWSTTRQKGLRHCHKCGGKDVLDK